MGLVDGDADDVLALECGGVALAASLEPLYGIARRRHVIGKHRLFLGNSDALADPGKIFQSHFHLRGLPLRQGSQPWRLVFPSRQKMSYTTEITRRTSSSLMR